MGTGGAAAFERRETAGARDKDSVNDPRDSSQPRPPRSAAAAASLAITLFPCDAANDVLPPQTRMRKTKNVFLVAWNVTPELFSSAKKPR